MFGLAGVFVLLGLWPRRLPGLWELPIANKAGLTIAEALLIGKHAVGARLARGWRAVCRHFCCQRRHL